MKTALIAAVLTGVCALPAFAADSTTAPQGSTPNFEQKKGEVIQHVSQKIARDQEELTCVQSATSLDALKTCRDKFRPQPGNDRQNSNQNRGE